MCSALVEKAEITDLAQFLLEQVHADLVINAARKVMGGLWAGGHISLYADALVFVPDIASDLLHAGNLSWRIPVKDILQVQSASKFLTREITIRTEKVSFKIRCYNADEFLIQINRQRQLNK
jgi:hypothetical protein